MTTDRQILFFSTYLSGRQALFRASVSGQRTDVLTTDRRILFFFTYLSGRRASALSFRRATKKNLPAIVSLLSPARRQNVRSFCIFRPAISISTQNPAAAPPSLYRDRRRRQAAVARERRAVPYHSSPATNQTLSTYLLFCFISFVGIGFNTTTLVFLIHCIKKTTAILQ